MLLTGTPNIIITGEFGRYFDKCVFWDFNMYDTQSRIYKIKRNSLFKTYRENYQVEVWEVIFLRTRGTLTGVLSKFKKSQVCT